MKSLRSSGVSTAARTARRSSRLPPKRRCSVSTLIAAAPPAAYCRGERGRVGDVGEVALAGAAALDLGDHAGAGGAEVRHRVARRVDVGERGAQVGQAGDGLALGEVDPHAGDDVVEHGHGTSIGSERVVRAKPLTPAASGRRARWVAGAQGASQAPDRQVAGDREGGQQRRRPPPSSGARATASGAAAVPPRQQATSRRTHSASTTGSASTSSRLLDAAAPRSRWVRSLTARRLPQTGQQSPSSALGQNPHEPDACGSRTCSASGAERRQPARGQRRAPAAGGRPRSCGDAAGRWRGCTVTASVSGWSVVEAELGHHGEDDQRGDARARRRPRRSSS